MESQTQETSVSNEESSVNGWFQIAVPEDGLIVSVKKIVRHTGNGKPVKAVDILNKLKQSKVVYGIDRDAIDKLITSVDENNIPEEPVVIAKSDVENGTNGSIEWCIDGITDEGSTYLVVPGVKIAVKTLSSQGKKGKTVFGKDKNARPGFDQQIINEEGVIYTQETDGIVDYECSHTGLLHYKSGTLTVDSGLDIAEDKLQVCMDIHAGKVLGLNKEVSKEDILKTLESAGVVNGIDHNQIESALKQAQSTGDVVKSVIVAKGDAAVNGEDELIEWAVDIQSEDINKRAVLPGQTIARIKSNINYKAGLDVFGEIISGDDGVEATLNCGYGIEEIKTSGLREYKALTLGVVQLESEADTVSVKSGITISDDKLKVTMSLLRSDVAGDEGNILLQHVVATLNEHDVVYGIKTNAIKLILENINREKKSKIDLLVAEGVSAKDGIDARVEFDKEFSVGGKILPNGEIDYHEKSYPWNVKIKDVIGKLIPAIRSEDGRNVIGEELLANQVKDSEPELEGVIKEADGTLRITEDGILLVNGINFKVSDNLELDGDVCQKTGNINSDKTVNIKGYVGAGFVVETKGDAIIQENVENATVKADGSVTIKSGIRGTQSKIIAGQNIAAAFAENADLNATGDILIENSLINCNTNSQGLVQVGNSKSKKSILAGDVTQAIKGVEVAILGSDSFNKTIIEVGAGNDVQMKLTGLVDEILRAKKAITDVKKLHEHCCKNPKSQKEQNALLLKLTGTLEQKNSEFEGLLEEKEALAALMADSKDARVVVRSRVYPGVVIRIMNKVYEVKEERTSGIFLLKGEEVVFAPA